MMPKKVVPWRRKHNDEPRELPPYTTRLVYYVCWRCQDDEDTWDGRFAVLYHWLPYDGVVYCPRCGKSDQVEQISIGEAQVRWDRSTGGW